MQGIELGGFELAEFDRRRELCFWLVYGDGDAKNARNNLYLRRNSARLGLGCREAQGEATVVTNLGRRRLLLFMEATNRERACRESEREMESLRHGR